MSQDRLAAEAGEPAARRRFAHRLGGRSAARRAPRRAGRLPAAVQRRGPSRALSRPRPTTARRSAAASTSATRSGLASFAPTLKTRSPAGTEFEGYRKVVNPTPFGDAVVVGAQRCPAARPSRAGRLRGTGRRVSRIGMASMLAARPKEITNVIKYVIVAFLATGLASAGVAETQKERKARQARGSRLRFPTGNDGENGENGRRTTRPPKTVGFVRQDRPSRRRSGRSKQRRSSRHRGPILRPIRCFRRRNGEKW